MVSARQTYLEKEVCVHLGNTLVGPPTVDEEQLRQEPELTERVVSGHGRLGTLVPEEATSDVCLLNHRDVVRTVTNRQGHGVLALFDL